MILNKGNLLASIVARDDKKIPALDNIDCKEDGSTVGSSGNVIIAVGPVQDVIKDKIVVKDTGNENITVSLPAINDVLSNIKKDTKFHGLLEHINIQKEGNKVLFTLKDLKGQTRSIKGNVYRYDYEDVVKSKETIGNALKNSSVLGHRIVLNKRRFKSLIDAVDKICPDSSGDDPIFLEFSTNNDIIVRGINTTNGQRVICVMMSYKGAEGKWLEHDKWEESFYKEPLRKLKIKKKRKLKEKRK